MESVRAALPAWSLFQMPLFYSITRTTLDFHVCSSFPLAHSASFFSCAPFSWCYFQPRLPHLSQLQSSVPCQPSLCVVGWPCSCLFVWNLKSYGTLALVSPTTFSVISHQELKTSNSYVSQIFLYTIRLSVYHLSLHITSCYMLLDSLQGTLGLLGCGRLLLPWILVLMMAWSDPLCCPLSQPLSHW